MFRGDKLVVDVPVTLLEALLMGWALAYCGLKARRAGSIVLVSKECW